MSAQIPIIPGQIRAKEGWYGNLTHPLVWASLFLAVASLSKVLFPTFYDWVAPTVAFIAILASLFGVIRPSGFPITNGEIPKSKTGCWVLHITIGVLILIGFYVLQLFTIDLSRNVTPAALPLYIAAVTAVLVSVLELFTNDWRKLASSFVMKETQSLIVTAGGILVFLALLSLSDVAALAVLGGVILGLVLLAVAIHYTVKVRRPRR